MNQEFSHPALTQRDTMPLVYSAFSKHLFYYRMFISTFILGQGHVPLNPFMIFDYFLGQATDHDAVRRANNAIITRVDEVWVFGTVSNGVLAEILIAKDLKKPIKYFAIEKPHRIVASTKEGVLMEDDVADQKNLL